MNESRTTAVTQQVEELERRRAQLAFELAAQGREEVEAELTAVEDQLARLKRDAERAALAEAEGTTRAQEEQRAATERQRQTMEAKLEGLLAARLDMAAEVELAMARLEQAVEAYLAAGQALFAVAAGVGRARPRLTGADQLASFLSWRLSGYLPHMFSRPDHASRRPLVELLGGAPVRQPEPEPAKGTRGARR